MDEVTKNIVALEGMQDVPLPGMETIDAIPPKIFEENVKVVYRIVNEHGHIYKSNSTSSGIYNDLIRARNALSQVKNSWHYVWNTETSTFDRFTDLTWRLQASKADWYDLS